MTDPRGDWRTLMSPERRAHVAELRAKIAAEPRALPADLTASELGTISVARRADPHTSMESILGPRPSQGRLSMHMTGAGVTGHGVSAAYFSSFISRLDEALAFTARSPANATQRASRFRFAAVEQGSLSFELQAPDMETRRDQSGAFEPSGSTVESDALRALTTVLTKSVDGEDDALGSSIGTLPAEARKKLFSAMSQVARARWEIDGSLRQRDFAPLPIQVPLEATQRLRNALEEKSARTDHRTVTAEVSGFRREEGLIWLSPLDGSDRFPASAATHTVMRAVRAAGALEDAIVSADITTETRAPKAGSATLRTSRLVTRLEVISQQGHLPLPQ